MTHAEFTDWLGFHIGQFRVIARAFAEMSTEAKHAARQGWYAVLGDYSADDAKEASTRLLRTPERQPRQNAFDQHPGIIAQLIREANPDYRRGPVSRYVGGVPTYACPHCQDMGLLVVLLRGSQLEQAEATYGEAKAMRMTCAVACSCDAGSRMARGMRRFDEQYDDKPFCEPTAGTHVDAGSVAEHAAGRLGVEVRLRVHRSADEIEAEKQRQLTELEQT